MSAVLDGVTMVDDAFDEALSTCLGCRACEAVCPGLVPYGRAFEGARAELIAQRPTPGRRARGWALGRLLRWRSGIDFASWSVAVAQRLRIGGLLPSPARRGIAGIRPLRGRGESWVGKTADAIGERRGTIALLSGCVMDDWFGPVHDATVGVLRRAGYRVVVPARQTCCGALAAHDGQTSPARSMAERNVTAFAGFDLVVSDSAGCTAHLKEYAHWAEGGSELGARVRDVTELVASLIASGHLPTLPEGKGSVAIQDPCHLRHAQRIVAAPRDIVRAAGYTPVEIDPDGLCCGAAGVYSVLQPGFSAQLGARKAEQVKGAATELVASANPGCEMQLRAFLGADHRVVHPIELYWQAIATAPQYAEPAR
jgi:glycolate oxidase iron-sulfur subunit